jgi:hypothetical protein
MRSASSAQSSKRVVCAGAARTVATSKPLRVRCLRKSRRRVPNVKEGSLRRSNVIGPAIRKLTARARFRANRGCIFLRGDRRIWHNAASEILGDDC